MTRKRSRKRWHGRSSAVEPGAGAAPGALRSDPAAPAPILRVMAFGPDRVEERQLQNVTELDELIGRWPVLWLNVDGLGDAAVLQHIAERFGLHPLAMEDVVHVHQRPKAEQYDDHLYIVARLLEGEEDYHSDQLSLFLGRNFVVTFQEQPGDCFGTVRARIRRPDSRIRRAGTDYLAYALIDAVVDHYFPLLERLGERIEVLEEDVMASPGPEVVARIRQARHDLLVLRRAVWPLREALGALLREPSDLICEGTRVFLRDTHDHTFQVLDLVEIYRELAAGLMEFYLSSLSNRTNEAIRVLTIIATFFIPMSFVASLYGMNFDTNASPYNMPELRWVFGYPFALGLMALIAVSLFVYFYRKGWIRRRAGRQRPA